MSYQDNPLFEAVRQDDALEITNLIQSGVDMDDRDWFGNTPALFACRRGSLSSVIALHLVGASFKRFRDDFDCALHKAISSNNLVVMAYLLQQDELSQYFRHSQCMDYALTYHKSQAVKLLLNHGVELDWPLVGYLQHVSGVDAEEDDDTLCSCLEGTRQRNESYNDHTPACNQNTIQGLTTVLSVSPRDDVLQARHHPHARAFFSCTRLNVCFSRAQEELILLRYQMIERCVQVIDQLTAGLFPLDLIQYVILPYTGWEEPHSIGVNWIGCANVEEQHEYQHILLKQSQRELYHKLVHMSM